MKKAIILVAGKGTRLQPRTLSTHKCLTEVNGTPILKNALTMLDKEGISEVVLVVGYLADQIRETMGSRFRMVAEVFGCPADDRGLAGSAASFRFPQGCVLRCHHADRSFRKTGHHG